MDSALTLIVLMCCVVCQEDPYLVSSVEPRVVYNIPMIHLDYLNVSTISHDHLCCHCLCIFEEIA